MPKRYCFTIPKPILEKEYIQNKKSMRQIAIEFHCGETTIHSLLIKMGIIRRTRKEALKGRPFSLEHRINISQAKIGKRTGELNQNWKGGVSFSNDTIRRLRKYATFRRTILRMRGENCELCGKSLIKICESCGHKSDRHVHHIKDFANFPELQFSYSNVLVICYSCHKLQHKKTRLSI